MVFGSPIFLFWFLPIAYIVYRLLPGMGSRNLWLALASLVFYSFGQPVYLPLLLLSVVLNYLFGRLMMAPAGRGKRWPAACAVAANLLLLGAFKYLDFFAATLNAAFGLSIPLPGLTLPIGISFFTFQGLSYALDVHRDPDSGSKSLGRLLLYISFFPQLIAGPIIKYHDVSRQIDSRTLTPELTLTGLRRFIAGFAKKLLLANTAGRVVDAVYRRLYTPCGLRTLSPEDGEFRPVYAGGRLERDLAYHQGTVWPFPLGAYYLAYLKVCNYSPAAVRTVRAQLAPVESALREGCVGFLPEVYDGLAPGRSKGCFAQAWRVGELLRVY